MAVSCRAQDRVRYLMGPALCQYQNSFDFGGSFFTVALKEGGSELMHIDWGDSPTSLTFITSVGGRSVYFCIPQLRMKVPLRPGQFLAVASRLLSHFVTEISGETGDRLPLRTAYDRRVVIVAFCDHHLMKHSEDWVTALPDV